MDGVLEVGLDMQGGDEESNWEWIGGRRSLLVLTVIANLGNKLEEYLDSFYEILRESRGNRKEEKECMLVLEGQRSCENNSIVKNSSK